MAITIDQANVGEFASDTSGTTIAMTTSATVASNAFIVLTITCTNAQTVSSVSGGGLTWTVDKSSLDAGSSGVVSFASAQAPSGLASGTTITATLSASTAGMRSMAGTSFLGVATSSPVDTTSGPTTTVSTTAWTTASTTIQAGSVLIGCSQATTNLFTSTPTAPSIEAHDFGNGVGFAQTTCYRIESSGGAYTVAGTWSSASNGTTSAVAYLAGAAAASSPPPPLIMQPRISF